MINRVTAMNSPSMERIKFICRRRVIRRKIRIVSHKPVDTSRVTISEQKRVYGVLTRSEAKKRRSSSCQSFQPTRDQPYSECRFLMLPVEMQLKIMGYLGCRDLESLRRTSTRLQSIALHPSLWKEYEILDDKKPAVEVISDLKRMRLLKRVVIKNRIDTNDIIRQISLSNKHLEELHVTHQFTGLPMYLRATLMTRLVERCQHLHTISLDGVYCRSLKLYRLLGQKVFGNLRSLNVRMTMGQIRAFVSHLNERSRDNVYKSVWDLGSYWKVVRYLRCCDLRLTHK